MRTKTFVVVLALVAVVLLFAQRRTAPPPPPAFRAVIDLTQPLSEKFPNWEGTEKSPFEAKPLGVMEKDGYFTRTISLPEHFATHMDAPAHFAAGAWTVDQIPPQRLIGPLVVLDVTAQSKANADYQITVEDVARWERAHGQIPPGSIVLARTGWAARAGSMKDYRNADDKGVKHFPGFALETVKFLVEARMIFGLGIDTLSVDYGASDTYPDHHYTAQHNIYHLENVADLSAVPEAGAILVAAPAKLAGGSGGPVRILALLR